MTISLKYFLIIATIIYLVLIIKLIKKKELNLSFSIFWIFAGVFLIILLILTLISPGIISNFAKWCGFKVPANMVFCISIFVLFYIGLDLTWKLSREHKKTIKLTQELSIMNSKVEEIENKLKEK